MLLNIIYGNECDDDDNKDCSLNTRWAIMNASKQGNVLISDLFPEFGPSRFFPFTVYTVLNVWNFIHVYKVNEIGRINWNLGCCLC